MQIILVGFRSNKTEILRLLREFYSNCEPTIASINELEAQYAVTSTQPDNYDKYLLDQKFNRAEALEVSRSWLPAQRVLKLFYSAPSLIAFFNRRITHPSGRERISGG